MDVFSLCRCSLQKLEVGKQAAELAARQARAEAAAGAAREAVLEGQLEALRRKVGDAMKAAETAERAAGEEHEAALAAAAEWRKKVRGFGAGGSYLSVPLTCSKSFRRIERR